jgi:energy-converting hydrogenase Eha subunit E
MFIALIMGIALMYLVLVMQFGSFTAPLPVMLSLPLSLIGVVLALMLTGGTLNLMSFIGVIMLMGLVAKNAILLLDCARKEEAQGVDREEALMHAGPRAPAPDRDDHVRAHRRHDAGGDRRRRRRRVLPPDGRGDHRRHDHFDAAHAPRRSDVLRLDRDLQGPLLREVPPEGRAPVHRRRDGAHAGRGVPHDHGHSLPVIARR